MTSHIIAGDCLEAMRAMEPNSVDAIVCDPPYALTANKKGGTGAASVDLTTPYGRARIGVGNGGGGFMGKAWDAALPGPEVWAEALRVAKPGAHLVAFGGSRTFHRLACAIEDAGWEIRDNLCWLFGQGFPKSHNLPGGLGTALKPGYEPIILARKPLSGTVAATVSEWGTGAINVDACRIAGAMDGTWGARQASSIGYHGTEPTDFRTQKHDGGRWPANVVLSHAPECRQVGTRKVKGSHDAGRPVPGGKFGQSGIYGSGEGEATSAYANADGTETVPAWECVESCPVRLLDEQSGERSMGHYPRTAKTSSMFGPNGHAGGESNNGHGDRGGASRFFLTVKPDDDRRMGYYPKASRREREAGLEGMPRKPAGMMQDDAYQWPGTPEHSPHRTPPAGNSHPCVKPLALMRWLCRLVTPIGGTILDPFCGSGSTGCAAVLEGFDFVGIEMEPEYVAIAERRVKYWERVAARYHRLLQYKAEHPPERKAAPVDPSQLALFGVA